jgi:hypothetical protein
VSIAPTRSRRAGGALLAALLLACGSGGGTHASPDSPGPAAIPGAALSILFIGNSLTATNDLPGTVEAVGSRAGAELRCTAVAKPGFSLEDHWNDGEARRAIARGVWSYVVLQQGPSALPESRVLLNEYARRFDGEIRRVGARPALLMVWPSLDRRGDFEAVSQSYAGAAALIGGDLLPAGDAWRAAWRRDVRLPLYGPDGFHPSPLGSKLAALVTVIQLTGRIPLASALPDVSAADFAVLLDAAREVSRPSALRKGVGK